jgi:peptide/nickel transport system permease protein
MMMGPEAPPDAIAAFRAAWGLDEPLWRQYLDYIVAVLRGDLGVSMRDRRPALDLVLERLPDTLALMLPAFALKLGIGIPAGIYAALHRDTWIDRTTMAFSVAGYSIPNFVLGLMLVLLFAVNLRWLPSSGAESWRHLVLPVIVLGTAGAGILARFTRSTMLEVLGQPYVRTAIAKGVPWYRVINWHALPNAAIPTVTVVGFMVGSLIAGAVVTESVFAWPGIGRQLVVAVSQRDVAVVQVILLLVAASMVASNLAVDMLYGWLDPRVRTTPAKEG